MLRNRGQTDLMGTSSRCDGGIAGGIARRLGFIGYGFLRSLLALKHPGDNRRSTSDQLADHDPQQSPACWLLVAVGSVVIGPRRVEEFLQLCELPPDRLLL